MAVSLYAREKRLTQEDQKLLWLLGRSRGGCVAIAIHHLEMQQGAGLAQLLLQILGLCTCSGVVVVRHDQHAPRRRTRELAGGELNVRLPWSQAALVQNLGSAEPPTSVLPGPTALWSELPH